MFQNKRLGVPVDEKADNVTTPFTDSRQGQQPFGGWNKAGRRRFQELSSMIGEALQAPYAKVLEEAALAKLQKTYLKTPKGEEGRPKKKQRKQKDDGDAEEDLEFDINY